MDLKDKIIICLILISILSISSAYYYHDEYNKEAYPSGQMGGQIKNIEIIPDPWEYRNFRWIHIKYYGGQYSFGGSNVPIEKIQNLNYTPYIVYKNNKTYVYQNSWSWTWHTEDMPQPGIETFYTREKVLDSLSCDGYGYNIYEGHLNRTEALIKFGWIKS